MRIHKIIKEGRKNVVYDIRNDLSAIIGNSELLMRKKLSKHEMYQMLQTNIRAAQGIGKKMYKCF